MLSDTTGTRGGSDLLVLCEECMYNANFGSVRRAFGNASEKRLACVDLIGIHAEAFRTLWPFSPNDAGIPNPGLIEERLMQALACIIINVADIKRARQNLHHEDPGVLEAAKNRLTPDFYP
ncbi:hypothetical protein A4X13_0g6156 [Tilletia indica]|uniref:Uncharacterized protein n=1 Tax=Tilletia indica TaxID=43049 RepID=A0A8T8SPD6_9BASI|nr:hypothetical protein A4X13_0g6156 [Tilletia indica]